MFLKKILQKSNFFTAAALAIQTVKKYSYPWKGLFVTTSWRILLTFVVHLLLKQFTQTKKCNSLNFLKHTKYTFSKYGY
jgi:hypothetical protein